MLSHVSPLDALPLSLTSFEDPWTLSDDDESEMDVDGMSVPP